MDLLIITNYDEDHVDGLPNLLDNCNVQKILRNRNVTPLEIKSLKTDTGMGKGIDLLVDVLERKFTAPAAHVRTADFSYEAYCNKYIKGEIEDENNLSLVLEANCNGITFLFCGDMECKGWDALGSAIYPALNRTRILMAPHHGRVSGCWEPFKEHLTQNIWTIISDKEIAHETQKTIDFYRSVSSGQDFAGEFRQVLTTRTDGPLTFTCG